MLNQIIIDAINDKTNGILNEKIEQENNYFKKIIMKTVIKSEISNLFIKQNQISRNLEFKWFTFNLKIPINNNFLGIKHNSFAKAIIMTLNENLEKLQKFNFQQLTSESELISEYFSKPTTKKLDILFLNSRFESFK